MWVMDVAMLKVTGTGNGKFFELWPLQVACLSVAAS